MKVIYPSILAVVVLPAVLLSRAASFALPEKTAILSKDEKYQLVVIPPRFRHKESYQALRQEDFIMLSLAEGANVASAAFTGATVLKKSDDGTYAPLWARPLAGNQVPRFSLVLSHSDHPVVICVGDYGVFEPERERFSVYDFKGRCLTNSFYSPPKGPGKTSWDFDGLTVRLLESNKKTILSIPVQ